MITAQIFDPTDIRLTPAYGFEFRASPKGEIQGLASPFGGLPDSYGDRIADGAFAASLARHASEGTSPAMLWSHDGSQPIGRWTELVERVDGLHVKGQFALTTAGGKEAFEHARSGSSTGLSIGGYFRDWQEGGDGCRLITQVDLIEISMVATPAASKARIHTVKTITPVTLTCRADVAQILRDGGLSRGAADKIARGGWPALGGDTIDEIELADLARDIRSVTAVFNKGLK